MKQVIVVRKDLGMRKGKLAAQVAHASLGATLHNLEDPRVDAWLDGAFTKIVLSVDSEDELLALVEAGRAAGLITEPITDSGKTEFHGVPTLTCAAFGPDTEEKINAVTGGLKLI